MSIIKAQVLHTLRTRGPIPLGQLLRHLYWLDEHEVERTLYVMVREGLVETELVGAELVECEDGCPGCERCELLGGLTHYRAPDPPGPIQPPLLSLSFLTGLDNRTAWRSLMLHYLWESLQESGEPSAPVEHAGLEARSPVVQ